MICEAPANTLNATSNSLEYWVVLNEVKEVLLQLLIVYLCDSKYYYS